MVNQLEMLYEGKAKKIYATDKEDMVIVHYKDDATAFNGEKKAQIESKGVLNNEITSLIFEMLNREGIKTHFVEKLNDRDEITAKVNEILKEAFKKQNINLIDFKLEFGRYKGEILLADEISPDTCRFWDATTGEKMDKDRFRRDMGNVINGYREVLNRLRN